VVVADAQEPAGQRPFIGGSHAGAVLGAWMGGPVFSAALGLVEWLVRQARSPEAS
jgi:hypothetical protein